MSLLAYAAWILGAVFGGLVLLVMYSLLAMAKSGEDEIERELTMLAASKNGQTKNGGDHPCTL
jgi:hypothetical protein